MYSSIMFNSVQNDLYLTISNIFFPGLEECRGTVTFCQSKYSDTRGVYIRERGASRRCRLYHKSRMHNREGKTHCMLHS